MTRVSVLMSVFNGEEFLAEAIESIINQSFKDFEFIIINDGSTDSSAEIIKSFQDTRIRYHENENNIGLARSLNIGFSWASGEYIARMDADDISLSGRLEAQVVFLDANPDIGVLGTAARIISDHIVPEKTIRFPAEHGVLCWAMCYFINPIIHPSVMIRRELLTRVGGYNEEMRTSQDFELWSRLFKITRFSNIQEVHLHLRKHEESVSHQKYEEQKTNTYNISWSMISSILNRRIPEDDLLSLWHFIWSPTDLTEGDMRRVSYLIMKLYQASHFDDTLFPSEKDFIYTDSIEKMSCLLQGQSRRNIRLWPAFLRRFMLQNMIMERNIVAAD